MELKVAGCGSAGNDVWAAAAALKAPARSKVVKAVRAVLINHLLRRRRCKLVSFGEAAALMKVSRRRAARCGLRHVAMGMFQEACRAPPGFQSGPRRRP